MQIQAQTAIQSDLSALIRIFSRLSIREGVMYKRDILNSEFAESCQIMEDKKEENGSVSNFEKK